MELYCQTETEEAKKVKYILYITHKKPQRKSNQNVNEPMSSEWFVVRFHSVSWLIAETQAYECFFFF